VGKVLKTPPLLLLSRKDTSYGYSAASSEAKRAPRAVRQRPKTSAADDTVSSVFQQKPYQQGKINGTTYLSVSYKLRGFQ
jgi:hypothetical protein